MFENCSDHPSDDASEADDRGRDTLIKNGISHVANASSETGVNPTRPNGGTCGW
jgi:hypothetical protein